MTYSIGQRIKTLLKMLTRFLEKEIHKQVKMWFYTYRTDIGESNFMENRKTIRVYTSIINSQYPVC